MSESYLEQRFRELLELLPLGGTPNDTALRRFHQITGQLQASIDHPYAREKVASAARWAHILFSARKHEKFSGGASAVAGFIRADLSVALRVAAGSDQTDS